MKKAFRSFTVVSLLIVLALFYGCKKKPDMPTVTTTAISSITTTTAASGGNVTSDGGAEVTARGVCWGTATKPLVTGSKTSDSKGTGSFTSSITGLTPSTMYYVRAYATNSEGTAYGNELSFTSAAIVGATVTTTAPATITATSAVGGGNITADGGAPVTERGVCWATTANPTTANSKTASGTGTGTFTANITPLQPGTLYHVRAYAINSFGPNYGSDLTFTTLAVAPTVTTTATVTAITQTTATSGGNVTSDGGAAVTARGVCWNTGAGNPTINDSHTSDGTGTGIFTSSLTSLSANTIYNVRAYATNSVGTSYGVVVTFTTSPILLATVTTTAATSITATTAISGGNVSASGGGTITARGICWGISANPDISGSHTTDGSGQGVFTSSISGLSGGTLYYARAYATNLAGTSYGNQVQLMTMVADAEGNLYKAVIIGTQTWMAENLKATKYRDGITDIPLETDNANWAALTGPAYCWYNNDEANKTVYGALYNWFTVNTGNLCPTGWSVPTDDQWTILTTFLGGESVAGGKLKESGTTHWLTPNTGATNETGFTALPGGYRYRLDGTFADITKLSYWWSSTEYIYDATKAYYREMFNDQASVFREGAGKTAGKYVRCLKN